MPNREAEDKRSKGFFEKHGGLFNFVGGVLVGAASVFVFFVDRISSSDRYEFMVGGTDAIRDEYAEKGWKENSFSFQTGGVVKIPTRTGRFWTVTSLECDIVDNKPPDNVRITVGMDGDVINVYAAEAQGREDVRTRLLVQTRTAPFAIFRSAGRPECRR